jgi:hypothetical protein
MKGLWKKSLQRKLNVNILWNIRSTEMLCKGLPDEFSQFMNYTKNLKFDEKPDYSYIRTLFRVLKSIINSLGCND